MRRRGMCLRRALLPCTATSTLAVCCLLLAACDIAPPGRADGSRQVELQVERGRVLLARHHCGACHSIPGVPAARGELAASLQAYGRRSYIAGRVANEPVALARWIVAPASIVPGTLMPDMGVAPADARDMAAYLGQLR